MAGRFLRNRDVKGLFYKDFIKEGKAVDDSFEEEYDDNVKEEDDKDEDDDDNNGGNLIGCGCSQ